MARAAFANLGVVVVVLAAWSSCGRTKPPPGASGSGGAAGSGDSNGSGGAAGSEADSGSGGTPGSGGDGSGAAGGAAGQGGAVDTGDGGAGGVTSVDAGLDGPLPICPFASLSCPSAAEGFQCLYSATPPCQMCIEGSRLRRPDEIIVPVPIPCTCTGGTLRCPSGPPPLNTTVSDCHLELPLSCADAAGWFVDSFCQEPAPCTP